MFVLTTNDGRFPEIERNTNTLVSNNRAVSNGLLIFTRQAILAVAESEQLTPGTKALNGDTILESL